MCRDFVCFSFQVIALLTRRNNNFLGNVGSLYNYREKTIENRISFYEILMAIKTKLIKT